MQRHHISRFLDHIAQYSCLKLVFAANAIGVALFIFFYLIGGFDTSSEMIGVWIVIGITIFCSALPFHFYVAGSCEAWRRKRKSQ